MSRIPLNLGPAIVVRGGLAPGDHRQLLMEVDLPDGDTVAVGWVPEQDPQGRYRIVRFRQNWRNRKSIEYCDAMEDVIRTVRRLVGIASPPSADAAAEQEADTSATSP